MDRDALLDLKRRVSPALLAIPGVSGVGTAGDALAVYLESDSPQVRAACEAVVRAEAPGVELSFVVTGPFRKQ
jgi:hypothetical protein